MNKRILYQMTLQIFGAGVSIRIKRSRAPDYRNDGNGVMAGGR